MVIKASIIPASHHSDQTKRRLRSFGRSLASFDDIPSAIQDAGAEMGIKGFKNVTAGPSFGGDVLRIEVTGPTNLHLTVVDLPGLIAVASEEQTEEDVEIVRSFVDSYVSNPRTIILAVVQAGNDIANQGIIQRARKFDAAGERTVGIITKPDLINKGTEPRIALLAKNQDTTKLKLGFFTVRNPSPMEMDQGLSTEQRSQAEHRFFDSSPWKELKLNSDRVGIKALKTYLQSLLDEHIERELPKVRDEIKKMLKDTLSDVEALGQARSTATEIRMFLISLSTRFQSLVSSALDGIYSSDFFSRDDGSPNLLRADVQQLNANFSTLMVNDSVRRKIVDKVNDEQDRHDESLMLHVTKKGMNAWIKSVYQKSRGKELPGTHNSEQLNMLFHEQSIRWYGLAQSHVESVEAKINAFVDNVLKYTITDQRVLVEVRELTSTALQTRSADAMKELDKLIQDEKRHPCTYNHYFTDNVQKARDNAALKEAMKSFKQAHGQGELEKMFTEGWNFSTIENALRKTTHVDMDDQACQEILEHLNSYYKVSCKTFVDNVCRQVIERHLIHDLREIFCPENVAVFSDEHLFRIAAETETTRNRRKDLQELHKNLSASLKKLKT